MKHLMESLFDDDILDKNINILSLLKNSKSCNSATDITEIIIKDFCEQAEPEYIPGSDDIFIARFNRNNDKHESPRFRHFFNMGKYCEQRLTFEWVHGKMFIGTNSNGDIYNFIKCFHGKTFSLYKVKSEYKNDFNKFIKQYKIKKIY